MSIFTKLTWFVLRWIRRVCSINCRVGRKLTLSSTLTACNAQLNNQFDYFTSQQFTGTCSNIYSPLSATVVHAFSMWKRWNQIFGWCVYATQQQLDRRPDILVGGGVFCLSGVRVERGELTPWGIQCHLLFVCPCRNMPSVQTDQWRVGRQLHLILCWEFSALEFGAWLSWEGLYEYGQSAQELDKAYVCWSVLYIFKSNLLACDFQQSSYYISHGYQVCATYSNTTVTTGSAYQYFH